LREGLDRHLSDLPVGQSRDVQNTMLASETLTPQGQDRGISGEIGEGSSEENKGKRSLEGKGPI
jgi:hypothetical protein